MIARETLRKPMVRSYVQELLEKANFGVEVRASLLADIGHGRTKSNKTLTMRNSAGEITSTQTIESDIPPSVRLRAIAHADKIDGTTDKAGAEVRLAEQEYSTLRKKLLAEAGLK